MNNAYKSVIVEMSVGDREYLLLEATAGNTLVKQVAYFYRTQASVATLYIQKKNGSVIEVNRVNASAAQSVDLNTDVIALEVGDRVIVSSDRVSALDVGHASAMYVESTYLPSYPSILALSDVSPSTTDDYVLTWDDATQTAVWSASTGGGSTTLDGLTDTNIVDPLEHDALIYDSVSAQWVNGIPSDIPVINTSGSTLTAGTPVRANGVQGDRIIAVKYLPLTDPKLFIGLVAEDIVAGGTGFVRQIGMIHHLDTSGFQIGDILYPISSLGGGLLAMSTTPPTPPNYPIPCAIVLRVHENTGRVYVRTWSPTYKLTELGDVYTPTLADGDTLVWNATNFRWEVGGSVPDSLGDVRDVTAYDPALLGDKAILRWSATSQMWELVPQTSGLPSAYYLGAYDSEAASNRVTASTASMTVERYLTIQGDGEGESISAQSDTPSSGNIIVRKIWFKANSFEQSDANTWTLVHTFADDTAYSATEATFEALLNEQTYGTPPFTLAQSWEEVVDFTGLLETYPGAAAAYSLRRLNTGFNANDACIAVRRASDNAIQAIGFDANGDLDVATLEAFCAGTDGFISTWADQSGNQNNATQATTSAQPQIVASGAVILDPDTAKPAAYSAGTQWMYNSSFTPTLSGFVMFMVHHQLAYNGTDATVGYWSVDDGNDLSIANNYSLLPTGYDRTYFFGTSLNFPPITAQTVIRSTTYDNSAAEVFINNTNKATGTPGALGTTAQRLSIFDGRHGASGAAYCIQGYVSSFIFYPSSSAIANRAAIESNINTYYSIY